MGNVLAVLLVLILSVFCSQPLNQVLYCVTQIPVLIVALTALHAVQSNKTAKFYQDAAKIAYSRLPTEDSFLSSLKTQDGKLDNSNRVKIRVSAVFVNWLTTFACFPFLVLAKTPYEPMTYVGLGALFFIFEAVGKFTWRCQLLGVGSLILAAVRSIFVVFFIVIIWGNESANEWFVYSAIFVLGFFQGCFEASIVASLPGCTVEQLKRVTLI